LLTCGRVANPPPKRAHDPIRKYAALGACACPSGFKGAERKMKPYAVGQKGGTTIVDVPLGLRDHPFKIVVLCLLNPLSVFLDELDMASDPGPLTKMFDLY